MKVQLLPSKSFNTNVWSGGTTTELFIFPSTANYAARNFDFRLSTATVEVETSEFTALPGIARKLMVLEGKTTLTHQNHHTAKLAKFAVDTFLGDWKTTSAGKCTDFNVMTRGEIESKISGFEIQKDATRNYQLQENCTWLFVYVFNGEINLRNQNISAKKGDLFVLENPTQSTLNLKSAKDSELVFTEIFLG